MTVASSPYYPVPRCANLTEVQILTLLFEFPPVPPENIPQHVNTVYYRPWVLCLAKIEHVPPKCSKMSKVCTFDLRRASEGFRPAKSENLHYWVQALVDALDVDDSIAY